MQHDSINDLPELALGKILFHASENLKDWITVFPSVCREWQNCMPLLWSKIDLLVYDAKFEPEFRVFHGDDIMLNLSVRKDAFVITKGFGFIIDRCPRNVKLELNNCFQSQSLISISSLFTLENLYHLKYLTIRFPDEDDILPMIKSTFTSTLQNLTNLEEIEISDSALYLNPQYDTYITPLLSCNTLKSVTLSFNRLVDIEHLRCLQQLHELETFCLVILFKKVSSDFLCRLAKLLANCSDNLRNVLFGFFVESTGRVDECRQSMLLLAGKSISSLDIAVQPEGVAETVFSSLLEFNELTELTLRNVDFANNVYPNLLKRLKLTKFHVMNCKNLYDNFFNSFRLGMQTLEEFSIHGCEYRRDTNARNANCLIGFLVKCPMLTKFSFCPRFLNEPMALFFNELHFNLHINRDVVLQCFKVVLYDIDMSVFDKLIKEKVCGLKISKAP